MNTEGERQYFFLSKFYHWGGAVTFTTHLLNSLRKKRILYIRNTFENDKDNDNNDNGNFGYGIEYKIVNEKFLEETSNPFIVDFFRYNHILDKLKRDDITIVIHDPTEISKENESYLRYWKIICIRKTLQQYLKKTYDIESKFLYHPFYPYSRTLATMENISHNSNNSLEHNSKFYNIKEGYNCYAVSNGKELAEIIKNRKNIDTIKVISNAKKLLYIHINVDWSSV